MGRIIEITGTSDPGADVFFHLTDAQMRSRQEPERGILITEGPKVTGTALDRGLEPVAMLMRKKMISGTGCGLIGRCGDVPVYTAEDETLAALTGFRLQRSWVLCAFRRPPERPAEEAVRNARRVAVLEGITEPSNLGAVFRSAAALGTDAILLTPDCCDPYHRRAVRVCMGAVFTVPWARTGEDHGFALLWEHGFFTVGLALREDALRIDDPELTRPERLAVYLGTEDTGLREETIARCDRTAVIPMAGGIDSLNVAAASAVAFWQLRVPERGGEAGGDPSENSA